MSCSGKGVGREGSGASFLETWSCSEQVECLLVWGRLLSCRGRELACGGESEDYAEGEIYSVPKEGVSLFFGHGDSRGGGMPSSLDWEGELLRVDIWI